MKAPNEIKLALEICAADSCRGCPYEADYDCYNKNKDALAYIQQLERERDALKMDMYHAASDGGSFCDICKYKGEPCDERKAAEMECWQWRGVQEV